MTTILIVEDNPQHMMLAATLLELNGYAVLKAENAEDGLALARSRQPDLVLMDIKLPGMDGLEAVKQLRADAATRAIKVIVLTSFRDEYPEAEILASGADAFLPKPYHHKDFLGTMTAVLGH